MWPYNEDEARWLKPRERAAPPRHTSAPHVSANDNDPTRGVPARGLPKPAPTPPPKT
jgi:hypothetical protein